MAKPDYLTTCLPACLPGLPGCLAAACLPGSHSCIRSLTPVFLLGSLAPGLLEHSHSPLPSAPLPPSGTPPPRRVHRCRAMRSITLSILSVSQSAIRSLNSPAKPKEGHERYGHGKARLAKARKGKAEARGCMQSGTRDLVDPI